MQACEAFLSKEEREITGHGMGPGGPARSAEHVRFCNGLSEVIAGRSAVSTRKTLTLSCHDEHAGPLRAPKIFWHSPRLLAKKNARLRRCRCSQAHAKRVDLLDTVRQGLCGG